MKIAIIGAGGIGGWIARPLSMISAAGNHSLHIVDGDRVEKRNLDRQMFTKDDIGKLKVDVMARALAPLKVSPVASYVSPDRPLDWLGMDDWALVGVDNHPTRAFVLSESDIYKFSVVLMSNEVWSFSAYVYLPKWKGTERDPRVMFPELLEDHDGAPVPSLQGCVTRAIESGNTQTIGANFSAASAGLHLFNLWVTGRRGLSGMDLSDFEKLSPTCIEGSMSSIKSK